MFTGIVVEMGEVMQPPPRLVLRAPQVAADAELGASVAIDGCCLTVVAIDGDAAQLRRRARDAAAHHARAARRRATASTSSRPCASATAWAATACRGTSTAWASSCRPSPRATAVNLAFSAPEAVLRYVVEKGSIAVDGVSLTVTGVRRRRLRGRR